MDVPPFPVGQNVQIMVKPVPEGKAGVLSVAA